MVLINYNKVTKCSIAALHNIFLIVYDYFILMQVSIYNNKMETRKKQKGQEVLLQVD